MTTPVAPRWRKVHYLDLGLTFKPAVADLGGFIDYREGYEQLPHELQNDGERFLAALAKEIAAIKKGPQKP